MPKYYDWPKTFSYDADINIIVSERGYGKTYGLRKQCVKDFLKDGSRFVVIVRYKNSLKGDDAVQRGFFEKLELNDEFPDYVLKTEGTKAYIADKPKSEDEKPSWKLIGYFVALTNMQRSKEGTFVNVRRVIFDEFIIDKRTRAQYLQGEFGLFVNVLSSIAREEVGKPTKVRAYLLGNACDLTNPYFARYGITKAPDFGYTWHFGKTVLLHYSQDKEFQEGQRDTLVGRAVKGTQEERIIIGNEFANSNSEFIAQKTKNAKFSFGIVYRGELFGIWCDEQAGYYYVNRKVPNNSKRPIYSLTCEDNSVNYIAAKRAERILKSFVELYYLGIVRYDSPATYERLMQALALFGVR